MLTDIKVKNFRGLRSLTLDQLGRITLVGGKNGVGKTALLEALWLLSGPDLPELSERINTMRGLPLLGPNYIFQDIFTEYDTSSRIRISAHGNWSGKTSRTLEIFLQERRQVDTIRAGAQRHPGSATVERVTRPQFESESEIVFSYGHNDGSKYTSRAWWVADQLTPAGIAGPALTSEGIVQERETVRNRVNSIFMPAVHRENLQAIASRFSNAQLNDDVEKILALLRLLEPRLKGLTLITIKDAPVIHAYLKDMRRPMPVQLLGEGLNRMLAFALSVSGSASGTLLIDEIENGLHYSVQQEVFSGLLDLAKAFDVQIFATTHSRECIVAAHEALKTGENQDFAYYRLARSDEEIRAVSFTSNMLDTAVEYGMEPR